MGVTLASFVEGDAGTQPTPNPGRGSLPTASAFSAMPACVYRPSVNTGGECPSASVRSLRFRSADSTGGGEPIRSRNASRGTGGAIVGVPELGRCSVRVVVRQIDAETGRVPHQANRAGEPELDDRREDACEGSAAASPRSVGDGGMPSQTRDEPEWLTRKTRIDVRLRSLGWRIEPYSETLPLTSADKVTIAEFPTDHGPADYALCVAGQVLGIIEAKKLSLGPQNVLIQAQRYSLGANANPLRFGEYRVPFLFSTNGEVIWY